MTPDDRRCEWCSRPLAGRVDQRFCGRSCRKSARRARRRLNYGQSNYQQGRPPFIDVSQPDAEFAAANERFRAAIDQAAEDKHRAELERDWTRYEAKFGVAHPDRVRDRIARQVAEDAAHKPKLRTSTIADRGRAERGRAPAQLHEDPPWMPAEDDDLEAPQMVDLGDWRRGRNSMLGR